MNLRRERTTDPKKNGGTKSQETENRRGIGAKIGISQGFKEGQ